jgi:hypothetical protein
MQFIIDESVDTRNYWETFHFTGNSIKIPNIVSEKAILGFSVKDSTRSIENQFKNPYELVRNVLNFS